MSARNPALQHLQDVHKVDGHVIHKGEVGILLLDQSDDPRYNDIISVSDTSHNTPLIDANIRFSTNVNGSPYHQNAPSKPITIIKTSSPCSAMFIIEV